MVSRMLELTSEKADRRFSHFGRGGKLTIKSRGNGTFGSARNHNSTCGGFLPQPSSEKFTSAEARIPPGQLSCGKPGGVRWHSQTHKGW